MSTFVMRWNTDLLDWTEEEYQSFIRLPQEERVLDWSIHDYSEAHIGDTLYFLRSGSCVRNGIVMRGEIISEPERGDDWSGQGREVYYISCLITFALPYDSDYIISKEHLNREISGFPWRYGHSGQKLTASQASQLEDLWTDYLGFLKTEGEII